MDHLHIAKVLDAGITESGRSYFAMELVDGCPITQFCGENALPTRERLKLFMDVCGLRLADEFELGLVAYDARHHGLSGDR